MTDAFYRLPSDTTNTGKRVDNDQVNDGTNDLLRQNIVTADPTDVLAKQKVLASDPSGSEYGAVVRNIPSGTQPVSNAGMTATAAATGAIGDAAWSGTGNGTIVSILKAIWTKLGAVVLAAGSAIIGKVGIDQTTPGTTNAVFATNLPTTADTNSGNAGASTLRAAVDGTKTTAAALPAGGTGTIGWLSAIFNAIANIFPSTLSLNSGNADATTLRVATDGTKTTASAMPTGGVGAIGWLSAIFNGLGAVVLAAGTAIIGKVGIDQTTPGTTNAVQATNFPATLDTNIGNAGASTLRVANDGTKTTASAMPTGGVGTIGWLSAIFTALSAVVLAAGTAIIGKVGIDQTTPGTTNAVQVTNLPATAAVNSGNADANTLRTANDGTKTTAATMPAGGTGTIGWLSAIFNALSGVILAAGTALIGYVRVTDATSTNFLPTMDAVARPGFQKITDGTNTLPTMDAVGRAGFQKITDGTNTLPTMDVAARAGFGKVTDGTNTAAVKAASTAAAASDPSLVVALSPNSPLPAGTSMLGDVGMRGSVSGGCTPYFANALKTNTGAATLIKSGAGKLVFLSLINTDSAPVYLQIFNKISGVTVGTTAPDWVIPYPANATAANGVVDRLGFDIGIAFSTGLMAAVTTTPTGSTASTNGLTGTIGYV